jgi:peptidoglycan hydrolase-like protein with peptidoglycan-binding domain
MRVLLKAVFAVLLLTFSICAQDNNNAQTNSNSQTTTNSNAASAKEKKRGPVFRASKDQIMQAQKMLKDKAMYAGEQTGKLDDATRDGLKKFQEAEGLKVTGTLNRVTLEKMNIALTEKEQAMP